MGERIERRILGGPVCTEEARRIGLLFFVGLAIKSTPSRNVGYATICKMAIPELVVSQQDF